jgi:mRNA interferase MazF
MVTTTIRVDRATHEELKRLARARHSTVAQTVARTVRALRQGRWQSTSHNRWTQTRPSGSMLTSGDIVEVDLGVPQGSEAGLTRPVIAVTAQRILARSPASWRSSR